MTKADDAAFAQGQENIEAYLAEQRQKNKAKALKGHAEFVPEDLTGSADFNAGPDFVGSYTKDRIHGLNDEHFNAGSDWVEKRPKGGRKTRKSRRRRRARKTIRF